jgi:hypothetical protein
MTTPPRLPVTIGSVSSISTEVKIMQQILSQVHQGLARVFLVGLLIQLYLAGAPLFGVGLSFVQHRMLGAALALIAILFPILALVGRLGRQLISLSLLLVLLTVVQGILPSLRGSIPWLASLHTINALALMGVSATISRYGRSAAVPVSGLAAPAGAPHSPAPQID